MTFGYTLSSTLFSGYLVNFGVKFEVNADRRGDKSDIKVQVIDTIKDFFKVEKMQFRQSINMNDLQYNILGLDGVIGIKTLELFQRESSTGINRVMAYYEADGTITTNGESGYGFEYSFSGAEENGIIRPSITPSVFELRNPNRDIYGKVV